MAKSDENIGENRLKWYQKLRVRYTLVIRRQDTHEERVNFQISRLNVMLLAITFSILLIVFTTLLIVYTPLKEYIPGKTPSQIKNELYELNIKADSLENAMKEKAVYLENVRAVLHGDEIADIADTLISNGNITHYNKIENSKSKADSLLRKDFENKGSYSLNPYNAFFSEYSPLSFNNINYFKPLNGIVTNKYDPLKNHFGIDIVTQKDEPIKSTLPGTVVFAEWTAATGYVIVVQHKRGVLSVYKHNAVLLKAQGDRVNAGEPIAIVGESGELSTGPHLHFELWFGCTPVNPEKYILF
ncbi:MAG: M23 family metallopeptidase [Bacteroidota bacterium]|nr:M23 family metallopeptidase [Bacteroidota bacterium]